MPRMSGRLGYAFERNLGEEERVLQRYENEPRKWLPECAIRPLLAGTEPRTLVGELQIGEARRREPVEHRGPGVGEDAVDPAAAVPSARTAA